MRDLFVAPTKRELLWQERYHLLNRHETALHQKGFCYVAGLDEAGRGPLAGPVYAAAVILDPEIPVLGLDDSKKLSEKRRMALAEAIREKALAWSVAKVEAEEIDRINILEATKLAMSKALEALQPQADFLLLDAITLRTYPEERQLAVTKGDATCNCIAAASILAKTSRDLELVELHTRYPAYGFAQHKGYGTKAHYEALDKYGPCSEHRQSFLSSWYERQAKYEK